MTTGCKRALGRHFSKFLRLSGGATPRETEEPSPGTQALAMIYTSNSLRFAQSHQPVSDSGSCNHTYIRIASVSHENIKGKPQGRKPKGVSVELRRRQALAE